MAFRAAVLDAYLAECCVCGFSLRLVDGDWGQCRPLRFGQRGRPKIAKDHG